MLTLTEAARLAGVSKTTLTRAIRAGRLSATPLEDGGFSIDAKQFSRVYKVKLQSLAPPEIPPGLLRADELAQLPPIDAPAPTLDPAESAAMPSVNDNPPPRGGGLSKSVESKGVDARLADADDARMMHASPLLVDALTVDPLPPTNDLAPVEEQSLAKRPVIDHPSPALADNAPPDGAALMGGPVMPRPEAQIIAESPVDLRPLEILDRALRAEALAASDDPPMSASQAAEPHWETSPGLGEPELTTRLLALDAEIRGLKHLLAEVKASRDQMRADRDDWRDRADRLLANLRRPWWRRLAG